MEARSFVGKDMEEALRAVRASFGPDALILQTRHVTAGQKAAVEVTALPDDKANNPAAALVHTPQVKAKPLAVPPVSESPQGKQLARPRQIGSAKELDKQQNLQPLRSLLHKEQTQEPGTREEPQTRTETIPKRRSRPTRGQEPETTDELRELRRELSEMKSLFSWFAPHFARGTIVEELVQQGLSPQTLSRVLQEVSPHGGDDRERIRHALARVIPVGRQLSAKRDTRECVALIGPSGVGKTTTIVRLTAYFSRQSERSIGWISLDNSRLTGSEQLAAYAGVLGIPYEVAETKEHFLRASKKLSSCDLVFIDTAGVNPHDETRLTELARFMRDIPALRQMLLLSTTTNERDMNDWVTCYEPLGFDSLLFTKLDEGRYCGSLVNTALACGRPLSYLTAGQNVTNSLQIANAEALAQLLLP